jgi:hypothetical protein
MSKQQFDLIRLTLNGTTFLVPREAGMAVFNMFANADVYRQSYTWHSGEGYHYAELVEEGAAKLESLGSVEFMKLRANAERYRQDKEKAKAKA